jgi:hypothetical protein
MSLFKFTRPDLQRYCPSDSDLSTAAVIDAIRVLIDNMNLVAIDDNHMASVCGAFLKLLLEQFQGGPTEQSVSDQAKRVQPIVYAVLAPSRWNVSAQEICGNPDLTLGHSQSVVVPGFEGRDRPSTSDFMRELGFWIHLALVRLPEAANTRRRWY